MSRSRISRRVYLLICISLLCVGVSHGQESQITPNNQTGLATYNTYAGDHENVNLASSDLNLEIPLVSQPGRNHHDLNISLLYDSRQWELAAAVDPILGFEGYYWTGVPGGGWRLNYPAFISRTQHCDQLSDSLYNVYWSDFVIQLPSGDKHRFGNTKSNVYHQNACDGPTPGGGQADVTLDQTTDGSLLQFDTSGSSNAVLRFKNGSSMVFYNFMSNVTQIDWKDGNGNIITYQCNGGPTCTVTDSLGRVVTSTLTSLAYKDSNGVQQTIALGFSNFTKAPTFSQPPPSLMVQQPGSSTTSLLSSVTLPNGRAYTMQYNNFAELTKISYPAGGYTRYAYSAVQGWYQLNQDSGSGDVRVVTNSYACSNSSGSCAPSEERITTYVATRGASSSNNDSTMVTDALGNYTVYTFTDPGSAPDFATGTFAASPRELTRKIYKSNGVLLRTIQTDWHSFSDGTVTHYDFPIRRTTTLDDGKVSKTEWDYASYAGYLIDDVTEERIFAFSSLTVPIIKHDFTYLKVNPVNGVDYQISLFMLDRKASEVTYDSHTGTNVLIAQTTYEYDSYTAGLTASGAVKHDSGFGTTYTTRGNVTAINRWRNTDGAWLTTRSQYDDAGNVLQTNDPLGHSTSFIYADSWAQATCAPSGGNAAAYLTSIANALNQTTTNKYNSCTGTLASTTDTNNQTTTFYYDFFGRLTAKNLPDGGQTSVSFNDIPADSATTTTKITSAMNMVFTTTQDGLGRTTFTQLTSDPDGTHSTVITFDALGQVYQRYNPTRCSPPTTNCGESTWGVTTYAYDALGRLTSVTDQDGSVISTSYLGNCTTVTDEVGKARKSCSDALGRLTQVFEDPAGLNYESDYTYDALNNLLTANQKGNDPNSANWRTRTFTYDSLSQLLTANNPESGTVSYTYDANGNLSTKTSPAPNQTGSATVTTTYSYDALNRITAKTYSDGTTPSVFFSYDAAPSWGLSDVTNVVGRLVEAKNQFAGTTGSGTSTVNSYDAMGRVLRQWQQTPSVAPGGYFTYSAYDLAGDLTSSTDAAGTTISHSYDSAGHVSGLTSSLVDAQHPATLWTADPTIGYYPHGALHKAALGNGLTETVVYEPRLQPCRFNLNSSGSEITDCTSSLPSGTIQNFQLVFGQWGVNNNGDVTGWSGSGAQNFNRTYTYDSLDRIQSVSAPGDTCSGLTWTIDPWGNRTDQTVTGGTCNTFHASANSQNRIIDTINNTYQYDAAGNMTHDASHSYTFDAENRIISVDGGSTASYVYDANGLRVRKNSGGSLTEYFYDGSGNVTAEKNPSAWPAEYVYSAGRLIAEYENGTTYFVLSDHLGSTRLLTAMNQSVYDSMDYLPFGEQIAGASGSTRKFTGKERDSESGLDNFGKRYFGSSLGRFMTPDPLLNSGQPWNPQSWNRYAYTENNPLRYTDPTGLYKFGNCSGTEEQCKADQQRFRDSITKAKEALKNLDPKSKEAKAIRSALKKIGEEGKGDIKINFGDAGKTNGLPNLGQTFGHNITINYDAVDSEAKDFNLSASETAALDAGVTTHEGTHALGNGLFGLFQGHFEHPAYYTESVTYQGLHNTDKVLNLWNESWLTVDKDKLSIERDRESSIQNAIHPPKQEQKQENPQ